MTTTLILIGIGLVLLVAVGAVLFSRARKVREREAVSRAIAAIAKAEDARIAVAASCETDPKFAKAPTRKTQAPIAPKAADSKSEAPIIAEPAEKKPVRELRDLVAAEAAKHFHQHMVMVGTVVKVDGQRVEIRGLGKLEKMELLAFPHGVKGVVMNSSDDKVEAVLLGEYQTIKEGDWVKRVPQLSGNSHLEIIRDSRILTSPDAPIMNLGDSKILISPDAPIMNLGDSLNDAIAKKKASAEWRSNSYLSGSPDRSDSGGRL